MKYVLIIGDGMAENPLDMLGGLTPLEKAQKPVIDSLAKRGVLGSVRTVPEGFSPGSDTAIMSIFGCAPAKYYSGRAPLEAAAQGIALSEGDAAMRCNNIALSGGGTYADRLILSHSAGSISGAEGRELVEYLFAHPEFKPLAEGAGLRVLPDNSYRHLCVQTNADISKLRLVPPHDHLDEAVYANLPSGCAAADTLIALMEKATEILDSHPVNEARRAKGQLPGNSIWFWAQGTAAKLPSFWEQFNKTGAVISAVALCQGIAALAGLDVIKVEGATAELHTNYEGKVAAALEALKTRDFAAVHIEAPDECSHNGDLPGKLQAIEWLDSRVTAPLLEGLDAMGEPYRILILSDHKTLLKERIHDGDPVPYIIYDSRRDTGAGLAYSEKNGEAGPFIAEGVELMPRLFEIE